MDFTLDLLHLGGFYLRFANLGGSYCRLANLGGFYPRLSNFRAKVLVFVQKNSFWLEKHSGGCLQRFGTRKETFGAGIS